MRAVLVLNDDKSSDDDNKDRSNTLVLRPDFFSVSRCDGNGAAVTLLLLFKSSSKGLLSKNGLSLILDEEGLDDYGE